MKNLLLIIALIIGMNVNAQTEDTTLMIPDSSLHYFDTGRLTVDNSIFYPTNSCVFTGNGGATLVISWGNDSINIECDGKMDEGSSALLKYLRMSFNKPVRDDVFKLMDEYEKHCYNDSTKYKYFDTIRANVYPSALYIVRRNPIKATSYTHKTPTFADFLKWIKTK